MPSYIKDSTNIINSEEIIITPEFKAKLFNSKLFYKRQGLYLCSVRELGISSNLKNKIEKIWYSEDSNRLYVFVKDII